MPRRRWLGNDRLSMAAFGPGAQSLDGPRREVALAAALTAVDKGLRIRAAGYELDGPKTVEVGAQGAPVAVKLRKALNVTSQLTSSEWLMSAPGTPAQKNMLDRCTSCHTLERPFRSSYDADALTGVL